VANQLKYVDLFDSHSIEIEDGNEGAIYNDFDSNPLDLLGGITNMPCYSQSSNISSCSKSEDVQLEMVSREAKEHALLVADKEESIFVDFLSFDSELYDISTEEVDLQYMEKVYKLVTMEDKDTFKKIGISTSTIGIFEMRHRNSWTGPDSIYDAWLLVHGYRRNWFPHSRFFRKYPNASTRMDTVKQMYAAIADQDVDSSDDEQCEETEKRKPSDLASGKRKKYMTESQVEKFFK